MYVYLVIYLDFYNIANVYDQRDPITKNHWLNAYCATEDGRWIIHRFRAGGLEQLIRIWPDEWDGKKERKTRGKKKDESTKW